MRIRPYHPRDEGDVLRMVRELDVDDPSPHAPGDDKRRSRGVGTALVEHGIATTQGAVAFELEVSPSATRARALYERLGFRPLRNASLRRVLALPSYPVR